MIKMHEIFTSVQFEGSKYGTPSQFYRFWGCNLKCEDCDTPQEEWDWFPFEPEWARPRWKHVVITGGEPTIQADGLLALVKVLLKNGHSVQVETNGTHPRILELLPDEVFITVSPKKGSRGDAITLADEVKIVPGMSPETFIEQALEKDKPVFIQPNAMHEDGLEEAIQYIKKYPDARLSIQVHKLLGWR